MSKRIPKFFQWLLSILIVSCTTVSKNSIVLENTGSTDYQDKIVSIPWNTLQNKIEGLTDTHFKIMIENTQQELPYQLEKLGGDKPVNLLVQVSLKGGEKLKLVFINEPHKPFKTRTYGRYVPERYDDFAWENDRIAFRTFGKALEKVPNQNAYGIDVWVKRTDTLIVNKRYKLGKYHKEHGDGLDYYHVGLTLGAGNCAPFVNDSIWYSKNYTGWKLLDNGPLRTTFTLSYDYWNVAGNPMKATKTFSLDAGSQLNKVEVLYRCENSSLDDMPLAIGIIKRPEDSYQLMDKNNGILGYWEPTHGEDGTTGVGVILTQKADDMKLVDEQFLAITTIPLNKPFVYYTGAAWDKAGRITNHEKWFNYLKTEQQKVLHNDIVVHF